MAKTLIDIDEEALEKARRDLGTTTKKDTVNRALAEVAAQSARRRERERFHNGDYADLLDPEVMAAAWRR